MMSDDIDYGLPATVFARQQGDLPGLVSYTPSEFTTLAEAIRHAVETLEEDADFYISGTTRRYDRSQVLDAYRSPGFPR